MATRHLIILIAASAPAWGGEYRNFCEAPPEVEREFQKAAAASAAVTDPFAALDKAAPFQAVRDRYPDNLFAHERYQDSIHEHGIEGHLALLARQYTSLETAHADDPMYRYLALRAIVGRNTAAAIKGMRELIAENANFAPAHRTLAEIYKTEAFRDPEQEKIEKEKFFSLCPGGALTERPPSIPRPSPLIEEAARLLEKSADADRIVAMTVEGLKEFEWRSQRIRAFDWYTRAYKLQDARDLRAKYWQAWPIQVRAYHKAGLLEKAHQVLALMEERARPLRYQAGSTYWNAQEVLAQLYLECRQTQQAGEKLKELQQLLAEGRDADEKTQREAQIERLRGIASEIAEKGKNNFSR
jgi:hypothetical protein